jgi:hypothetical protein
MTKVQDNTVEMDFLLVKNIPNEIVKNVMQIANTFIQTEGIDASSIMIVTTNVMEALGKYNTITGRDKKKISHTNH